jgi:hypothetical protein
MDLLGVEGSSWQVEFNGGSFQKPPLALSEIVARQAR